MKKITIIFLITLTTIAVLYFVITKNGMPRLNTNNVESVCIYSNLTQVKQFKIENNRTEIENLVSMYNKAKRNYRDGQTTYDKFIVFLLKDGGKLTISGNTQSFQDVTLYGGKSYKISGKDLTNYMRSLSKEYKGF